jgi:hypothetical protein
MGSRESGAVRVAIGAIAGCTTAVALYAIIRIAQALLFSEPDPALVIWSEHAGFFWRSWTAVYVGGMIGFVAYVAAGREPERTTRALAIFVVGAALLVAVQGVLVP